MRPEGLWGGRPYNLRLPPVSARKEKSRVAAGSSVFIEDRAWEKRGDPERLCGSRGLGRRLWPGSGRGLAGRGEGAGHLTRAGRTSPEPAQGRHPQMSGIRRWAVWGAGIGQEAD
ncbi:hypothetical protein P7K49_023314 [Saguinus oedipus]|uniref:Uncharacterized protein n=1 Tax=Saguinus oedipus TaxID=9490 RepID=A0ABQ9ULA8_SAGOE|nr:hypothetical protein P7K49_023314 [Saguinus oedipus]